jgi:hypothetical protein
VNFPCRADEAAQRGQGLHGAVEQLRDENGRLASQLAHLRAQLDRTSSEHSAKSAGGAAPPLAPSRLTVAATLCLQEDAAVLDEGDGRGTFRPVITIGSSSGSDSSPAEAAGLARTLAESEAMADAAARECAAARRRIADLERHGAALQAQATAALEETAVMRARCRWTSSGLGPCIRQ